MISVVPTLELQTRESELFYLELETRRTLRLVVRSKIFRENMIIYGN